MPNKRIWLIVFFVTFGGATARATTVTDCADVTAYGAVPNDGVDDQPAIQSAITAAIASNGPHAVCFPGGTYDIITKTGGVSFNLGGLTDLAFIGVGASSVLKMNGNGGAAAWSMFQINNSAQRISFRDLVLDGSAVTNAGTATNFLQIGTGDATFISDISLDGVTLRSSPKDAIVMLGASNIATISFISIKGSRFSSNLNNAITMKQGVQQVQITSSFFDSNTGLDVETVTTGTLSSAIPIDAISITSNIISRSTLVSPVSLYLHGDDSHTNADLLLSGNIIVNGRIHLSNYDRAIVSHNIVNGGSQANVISELYFDRHGNGSVIEGNVLLGNTSATLSPVLYLLFVSVDAPKRAVVRDNVIIQPKATNVVQFTSVANSTFSNNIVEYSATTGANTFYGLNIRAGTVATDYTKISDNLVLGNVNGQSLVTAFGFSTDTGSLGRISVTGNQTVACTNGTLFNGSSGYTTIPLITDNVFDGATSDINGLSAIKAAAIGGNLGGPAQFTGNGVPSTCPSPCVAAPVGSLYFRRDGTTGSTLYVKETGTDATGWVAK